MNNHTEHFIRSLRTLALSNTASKRIREKLVSYADMHAVADSAIRAPFRVLVPTWIFDRRAVYAFSFAAILLVSGGGATLAAERALPGDRLYAVKTQVNEKLAAAWVDTPEERARYSTRLIERRVDEAVVLADEGRLDSATATYLEEEVALHVETSARAAYELESEGDIVAALSVRAGLEERLTAKVQELEKDELATEEVGVQTATLMMRATATVEEVSPRAQFAEGLHKRLEMLAEARARSEATVLPGLPEARARGFDFSVLRQESDTEGAEGTATSEAGAERTTEVEHTPDGESVIDTTPLSPLPLEEDSASRALWIKTR